MVAERVKRYAWLKRPGSCLLSVRRGFRKSRNQYALRERERERERERGVIRLRERRINSSSSCYSYMVCIMMKRDEKDE